MSKRDGFVFYESFYDATRCLPEQTKLEAYRLLFEYALYGSEPQTEDAIAMGFFKLMRPQIDANNRRRENGCKGGRANQALSKGVASLEQAGSEEIASFEQNSSEEAAKDKVNVNVKAKAKAKDSDGGFRPPSLAEVRQYCLERGNNINPEQFIDFYAAKGWFVGKNKMKDWRAAIRTWERREEKNLASPQRNCSTGREAIDELLAEMEAIDI